VSDGNLMPARRAFARSARTLTEEVAVRSKHSHRIALPVVDVAEYFAGRQLVQRDGTMAGKPNTFGEDRRRRSTSESEPGDKARHGAGVAHASS
jgi:hypothetical protein